MNTRFITMNSTRNRCTMSPSPTAVLTISTHRWLTAATTNAPAATRVPESNE